VLDFQYPFQKFVVDTVLLDDSWINRFDIIDYEEFYRRAELDIRENLQYTGIVETTQNKTRQLLTGLLKNLGYDAIFIEFDPTEQLFKPLNIIGVEEDEE
jgi:uroporphyrinogen-III decarboxylase